MTFCHTAPLTLFLMLAKKTNPQDCPTQAQGGGDVLTFSVLQAASAFKICGKDAETSLEFCGCRFRVGHSDVH